MSWGAKIMPIKVLNLFGGGTEIDSAKPGKVNFDDIDPFVALLGP